MAHHRMFGRIARSDNGLLNLIFLLTVSFMPFPAALLCWAVLAPVTRAVVGRLRART